MNVSLKIRLFCVCAALAASSANADPRLDIVQFPARSLKDNPLHDPVSRRAAVFVPSQYTNGMRVPVVYYLPGWGGSSENAIQRSDRWLAITQKIADEVTPMLLVVVDCRTYWGGSQYLNSPAQGNYADYVCKEIVPCIEHRYSTATGGTRRIVAGHSSGGFGALRLGMADQKLFDAVVALSPDSDFPVSHLPLVRVPGVTNVSLSQVIEINAQKVPKPKNGDLLYAIGLSAAYAPRGIFHHGQFEWLYDSRGRFRPRVWQRWLDNDPLTIVKEDSHAFSLSQAVYLEGAAHDEYKANIGAREIYKAIRDRIPRCTFYEPPGRHGDHVLERLERGLQWVFNRPTPEIKP